MTNNNNASDYSSVILEEMRENFRVVMEAVGDIQRHVYALPEIRQNTRLLMDDVEVVKAAVRSLSNEVGGLNGQVEHHEHRIRHLESASRQ